MPKKEPKKIIELPVVLKTELPEPKRELPAAEVVLVEPSVEQLVKQSEQEMIIAEMIKSEQLIVSTAEQDKSIVPMQVELTEEIIKVASNEPLGEQTETPALELKAQTFFEVLDKVETQEIDFDEELTLEIPTLEEHEQQTAPYFSDDIGLELFTQSSLEIDEEVVQAALLWSEQWGEQEDGFYINESETPEKDTKALIEFLPISTIDLEEKLETLPEGRLQETAAILEAVFKTVSNLENNEKIEEVDLEIVTTKLEHMVERLFVCLEIEHEEEHVIAFVQAILSGGLEINFEDLLTMQDDGMHERKYTSAWILAVLKQPLVPKQNNLIFVSKYVLRLIFGETKYSTAV